MPIIPLTHFSNASLTSGFSAILFNSDFASAFSFKLALELSIADLDQLPECREAIAKSTSLT
jgi:hypothetical protein